MHSRLAARHCQRVFAGAATFSLISEIDVGAVRKLRPAPASTLQPGPRTCQSRVVVVRHRLPHPPAESPARPRLRAMPLALLPLIVLALCAHAAAGEALLANRPLPAQLIDLDGAPTRCNRSVAASAATSPWHAVTLAPTPLPPQVPPGGSQAPHRLRSACVVPCIGECSPGVLCRLAASSTRPTHPQAACQPTKQAPAGVAMHCLALHADPRQHPHRACGCTGPASGQAGAQARCQASGQVSRACCDEATWTGHAALRQHCRSCQSSSRHTSSCRCSACWWSHCCNPQGSAPLPSPLTPHPPHR